MTPKEAIKNVEEYIKKCNYIWNIESIFREYIKYRQASYVSYTANDVIQNCHRSLEMLFDARAMKAIEEVQQYRKIGTVEEIKKADGCIKLLKRNKTLEGIMVECLEYEKIGTVEEMSGSGGKTETEKNVLRILALTTRIISARHAGKFRKQNMMIRHLGAY